MVPRHLGRYEILGSLGKGAMGTVYKAHDPLIERTVAVKTVSCAGLSPDEVAAFEHRFFREAKSAGRLNHPNIVTIHDVGRAGDLAYIAMEFLEGESLREILDSGVVLSPERIADVAAQVADGLAFAHARGVVHRDIKPANIMVLRSGAVKIADFGVALLPTASTTVSGSVLGSPKYMSPEQVTGEPVDGRSDVFSLGAVLYEMLTGLPPFRGDDLEGVLRQVLEAEPPPPSARRRRLPAAFDAIVAKAMAKSPLARYGAAEQMAMDLRQAITTGGTEQATESPRQPAPRPRPMVPVVAGAAVAALAALATWLTLRPVTPEPPAPTVQAAVEAPRPPVAPIGARDEAKATVQPLPATAAPPRAAAAPRPLARARLQIAVSPWGEIYVDGRKQGISPPLTELALAPGKHVVEVRNAAFPPHRQTVILAPAASLRIKHKFAAPAGRP